MFFSWADDLLNVTPESIQSRMSVFLSRGIVAGPQMARIIQNYPFLLFGSDAQKMDITLETISHFFPADEVSFKIAICII